MQAIFYRISKKSIGKGLRVFVSTISLGIALSIFLISSAYSQIHPQYQKLPARLLGERNSAKLPSSKQLMTALETYLPELQNSKTYLTSQTSKSSPAGMHYSFHQSFQEIEIYSSSLLVNMNKRGEIISSWNGLFPVSKNTRYQSFELSIEEILDLFPQLQADNIHYRIEAQWLPEQGSLYPIYQVLLEKRDANYAYEWLIDGISGRKLSEQDLLQYHHSPAFVSNDTIAKGRVFLPNPCTRAEVSYGDMFIDDNDFHDPIFDLLMDTVDLAPLTFRDGRFWLENDYVMISDIKPRSVEPVSSADGTFFFDRSEDGFEDVMAFYHINAFREYIESLGFESLPNKALLVDPHGNGDADQSLFSSGAASGQPYLAFGEGGVDDAEDGEVLIHEYVHAITYNAIPFTSRSFERASLDEGLADYLAVRYSESLSRYEWQRIFDWDGHNEFWPGRFASSSLTYPPDERRLHVYGEVITSALFDIRSSIGEVQTDSMVLQSLYSLQAQMDFSDYVRNLLDVDSLLFEGKYADVIIDAFCRKNIMADNSCLVVSQIDDELINSAPFSVFPNPTNAEVKLQLGKQLSGRQIELQLYDLNGKKLKKIKMAFQRQLQLQFPDLQGSYILKVSLDSQALGYQKLVFF